MGILGISGLMGAGRTELMKVAVRRAAATAVTRRWMDTKCDAPQTDWPRHRLCL